MPGARRRPPDRWKSIGERGYSGSREKRGFFRHFHVAGGGGVIRGTVRCGACVPLCCLRWIGRVRARAAPVPQNAGRFGCFLVGFSPLLFFFSSKVQAKCDGLVCVCVCQVLALIVVMCIVSGGLCCTHVQTTSVFVARNWTSSPRSKMVTKIS